MLAILFGIFLLWNICMEILSECLLYYLYGNIGEYVGRNKFITMKMGSKGL